MPADDNTLLAVFERAFNERSKINHIVASKQPRQQWFSVEMAEFLATKGLSTIDWASTAKEGEEVDIVFASAGAEATIETLAALHLVNNAFPHVKFRYVNVVEIGRLQKKNGFQNDDRQLTDEAFYNYFGKPNTPVLFGFHGYEDIIESIFYQRKHFGLNVHGYREDGDITTTYDIRVYSELDRFHQAIDAVKILMEKGVIREVEGAKFILSMEETLKRHFELTRNEGIDLPEFTDWEWTPLKIL